MFNLNNLALKQGYKLEILVLTMIRSMGPNAACQTSLPKEAEPTEFPPGFPTPDPDDLEDCLEAGERLVSVDRAAICPLPMRESPARRVMIAKVDVSVIQPW